MVTRAQTRVGSSRLTKNYKRTRLHSPGKYERFYTVSKKGGDKVVMGVTASGKSEPQAYLRHR